MVRTTRSRRSGRPLGALLLACALLVPALLGLGQRAAAQEKATITWWFDSTSGAERAECVIANVVDPFNAQSETTAVDASHGANRWQATQTALAGGAGPDGVGTPGPSFAVEVARAGQLLPLDQFAEQFGWNETFAPWALDLGKVDGTLYSLPSQVETLVLFYNKTLFEENGWEVPRTIDEMMTLAATIDAAGIIPFAHGNAEWRPTNEWFVGEFLNNVAGPEKVYQALTGAAKWTDPAFVDAIAKLTQLQQNGYFMGGLDRYYTATAADTIGALADGDAAMKIEGTWVIADFDEFFGEASGAESDWGWAPVPSTSGQPSYNLGVGSTLSINKNTAHPEAVAEFITYFLSPETQARLVVACGDSPAAVALPEGALDGIDPRYAEILLAQDEASRAGSYGYTTWTFWPPKTETYLIENIERVWAGEMTPEAYLEGMQAIFDQELAEGSVPPIPDRAATG